MTSNSERTTICSKGTSASFTLGERQAMAQDLSSYIWLPWLGMQVLHLARLLANSWTSKKWWAQACCPHCKPLLLCCSLWPRWTFWPESWARVPDENSIVGTLCYERILLLLGLLVWWSMKSILQLRWRSCGETITMEMVAGILWIFLKSRLSQLVIDDLLITSRSLSLVSPG